MLRFFRQIRQKLIEQDKVRKYLWYALGEIFLVVIGILIALQINNWNQQNQTTTKAITYLEALDSEIEINVFILEYNLENIEKQMEKMASAIELFSIENSSSLGDEMIIKLLNENISPIYLSPLGTSVFQDIISSGIMTDIEDTDLKKFIFAIGGVISEYQEDLVMAEQTWNDYLMPYLINNYTIINEIDSLRGIGIPNNLMFVKKNSFVQNSQFENILRLRLIHYYNLANKIELIIRDWKELRHIMNEYVKKHA